MIRPGGALVLCALVWVLCGGSIVEALWVLGPAGWRFCAVPLAASVVVWALLWAPRVIIRPAAVEVRNVARTHLLPMSAIEDVRLGAMLRFTVAGSSADAEPVVVTAWNAPGVGKDRAVDRRTRDHGVTRGQERDTTAGWAERLVRDQRRSPSYAVVQAWEDSRRRRPDAPGPGDAPAPSVRSRMNRGVIAAVVLSLVPLVLRAIV